MKLGKQGYKEDPKTIKLVEQGVLNVDFAIPSVYDFDKHRAKFPTNDWGNIDNGDCVMATRANQLLRLERVETRRTVPITDQQVIDKYYELTGGPDEGLVMLDTNVDWRKNGWDIPTHAGVRHYTIEAFGELNCEDPNQLRSGVYLLHGIQGGFELPLSAKDQTDEGYWDAVDGPDSEPGSWGGHAVYIYAYDHENLYCKSWGKTVRITDAFISRYMDEAWAVVDSLDKWREALDVEKLRQILKDIGASGIQ